MRYWQGLAAGILSPAGFVRRWERFVGSSRSALPKSQRTSNAQLTLQTRNDGCPSVERCASHQHGSGWSPSIKVRFLLAPIFQVSSFKEQQKLSPTTFLQLSAEIFITTSFAKLYTSVTLPVALLFTCLPTSGIAKCILGGRHAGRDCSNAFTGDLACGD